MKRNIVLTLESNVSKLTLSSTDEGKDIILLDVDGRSLLVSMNSLTQAVKEIKAFNKLYKDEKMEEQLGNV